MLQGQSPAPVPMIRTALPGPRGKALIQQDEAYTSPSYTRAYPLAVARGQGAVIEDLDGNLFLDFTAGIAVCSTGHCHQRVVKAIQRQAEQLVHMSGTDFYYQPQADLARRLAELAPGAGAKRVFFTNSGAESVEAAFKLARHHTSRRHVIAFHGAFHGRTMGALSLTASKVKQRARFAPLVPSISHVDFPHCSQCPHREEKADCCLAAIRQIETIFERTVPPEEVAAIFVEPIQGEGGYIVPPPEFHAALADLARRHGILLIADEVQSGMGRTGRMFAMQHWGVEPDMICLAKGIASGMPLGALIARAEIMDWPPGAHASTFGGNPISCAAALETINLLEESLIAQADAMGRSLKQQLQQVADSHPRAVREVRGLGLMVAVDMHERDHQHPPGTLRDALIQACFRRGLLLLGCGPSAVRFCPPLVIDAAQVETAVRIFAEALEAEESKHDQR